MDFSRQRSAVEELLAEGMAQVQQAEEFAKAAQDPLDRDFSGLDRAKQASDAAHDDDEDGFDSEHDDDDAEEDGYDAGADDEDEDEDEDDGEDAPQPGNPAQRGPAPRPGAAGPGAPFAKSVQVDAMPLLAELDRKLETLGAVGMIFNDVQELKSQIATLAKAVQATAQGTLTLAKAVAPHVDAPVLPASQRARAGVPTRTYAPVENEAQVFAKAEAATNAGHLSPSEVALLNGLVNSRGVQGAREAAPHIFARLDAAKE